MPSRQRASMSRAEQLHLVVALTGRALAQSAKRGRLPVAVLDLYNDLDTRAAAARTAALDAAAGGSQFCTRSLFAAAIALCPPEQCAGLVTGSGFEEHPQLVERLAGAYPILGNRAGTIDQVKHPQRLGSLLRDVGLPFPESHFAPPDRPDGWIAKRIGGSGGGHVTDAAAVAVDGPSGNFFQRLVPGQPHSVTFLANGRRALVLGFNRQWTRSVGGHAYVYGGAINRTSLPAVLTREIERRLDRLVESCGLVGLNGLDFVCDGSEFAVVEINPRPSATIELYDEDYPRGLFALHVDACRGVLPDCAIHPRRVRAHAVIYTDSAMVLPARFDFPSWCSDRSEAGSRFAAASPFCTVRADGASEAETLPLLEQRVQTLAAAVVPRAA